MGISLKGLGRGLAAGAQIFGAGLQRGFEAQKAEELRKEKVEKEDKRFQAKREDQNIRNEQLRVQNLMNMTKLNAQGLANSASMRDYHPEDMAQGLSQHHPDGRVYEFNKGASSWDNQTREGAIVMNVGTYKQNPDGSLIKGSDGKPVFESLPGDAATARWESQKDFTESMAKRSNPAILFGMQMLELDGKKARQSATIQQEAKQKLAEGTGKVKETKAKTEKLEAETALLKEKKDFPEKFRTPTSATMKVAKVVGLDGKEKDLTSQGVNLLRSTMDQLGKEYEGVDEGVAHRLTQLRSNPTAKGKVRQLAELVGGDDSKRNAAINAIVDDYGLTRQIAEDMIDAEIEGGGLDKKDGFFSNIFG